MPREPIPLIRKSGFMDAEKLYILSYEGTVSEKKYFEDFRQSVWFNNNGLIETIPLKKEKNSGSDPISVKNLLKKAKDDYPFKQTDEFWLIIDRDHWETIHKLDFKSLVKACKQEKNFFLAISNPCFEVWLVLHLKNIKDYTKEEQQLILENAKVSNAKNYIDKLLGNLQGKGYNKRPDPKIFLPLTLTAIERAKALNTSDEEYPLDIGTHLYKLVEKLLDPNK